MPRKEVTQKFNVAKTTLCDWIKADREGRLYVLGTGNTTRLSSPDEDLIVTAIM